MIERPTHLQCMKPDRDPDFVIGEPAYMLRWWLVPRNPTFNVYYHRILRDDDDDDRALHDHPWPSFSIMVRGRLMETTADGERVVQAGECVYRAADMAHRLALIDGAPAETLFITGPRLREWGFHCPKGWVHWEDFTAPGDSGRIGRGCGEMS